MLRVAVLETETVAKDIIFELAKVLSNHPFTFTHFTKISAFAKADTNAFFDIVFFNEMFETQRVSASFIENAPKRIVVYCKNEVAENLKDIHAMGRIIYLNRKHVKQECHRLQHHFEHLLRSHDEYFLSYNNVHIPLRMQEIYYIEKLDKSLIYHTSRGEFRERKTMNEAQHLFESYDFLRIHSSYLVNVMFITKIDKDLVELSNHEALPLARARKNEVFEAMRSLIHRGETDYANNLPKKPLLFTGNINKL